MFLRILRNFIMKRTGEEGVLGMLFGMGGGAVIIVSMRALGIRYKQFQHSTC